MSLSQELEARGFIHQFSAPTLQEIVDGEKRTIYHGIDPSADSAHVGNMVVWLLLKHLSNNGHKIVFLVGGATGLVGDPKPDAERPLRDEEDVAKNVEKIRAQAEKFFGAGNVEFTNNLNWFSDIKLLDFLRDIGKHYTVNELIKKDAISARLQSDTGLSYTEFAYPLIQGYDYYELHKTLNCTVQVGGSDQWGNIVSGVDLVRRKTGETVYALTTPLITDKATGKKFGKSEGNAVWLDAEKTSPYQFYQFWFNVSDESVIDYLRIFTFLPLSEVEEIEHEFAVNPGSRSAQKRLALEVTKLVHGEEAAHTSQKVSDLLFNDSSLEELTESETKVLRDNSPSLEVSINDSIVDVLVDSKLATSKREARTFIESGAVKLSGRVIDSVEEKITDREFAHGLAILQRGKKQKLILSLK